MPRARGLSIALVGVVTILIAACARKADVAVADETSAPTSSATTTPAPSPDAGGDAIAKWPATRPAHLRVLFTRTTLPIGKPTMRDAIDLHVEGDACDPTYPCKTMSDAEADALWAKLVVEDFAAMKAAPRAPTSPHVAHASVLVEASGVRVEIEDGFRIGTQPQRDAFDRVVDAVLALAPPP